MQKTHQLKSKRVDQITRKFDRKKIVVFGDVGVDKYTVGKVSRISPEAPIPIVEVFDTRLKLGLAANVADNIVEMGGVPLLVGVVGQDSGADDFFSLLRKRKIPKNHVVQDATRKTTLKERVVAEAQQVVRIDHETQSRIEAKLIEKIGKALERAINEAAALVVEDYAKGLMETSLVRRAIETAAAKGIPILVDPNVRSNYAVYAGCTVITPNILEAEALSKIRIVDASSLKQAGARLQQEIGAEIVIITRGKDGMAIFKRGRPNPILIPTFAREVFDVSGAGDTVIATLALSLASGANIEEAALLANFAAGVEVSKRGTATVSVKEMKEHMRYVGALRR
ncbi:MAG TPA: D-glycero-beta-D-manno-heptose-7-phosphate kinase [Oligoflexia bacterium]|nr:D-glycero-beta-D-manno-heptose-7-phosphate kinase [Oligoflexia bacterium]